MAAQVEEQRAVAALDEVPRDRDAAPQRIDAVSAVAVHEEQRLAPPTRRKPPAMQLRAAVAARKADILPARPDRRRIVFQPVAGPPRDLIGAVERHQPIERAGKRGQPSGYAKRDPHTRTIHRVTSSPRFQAALS